MWTTCVNIRDELDRPDILEYIPQFLHPEFWYQIGVRACFKSLFAISSILEDEHMVYHRRSTTYSHVVVQPWCSWPHGNAY